MKYLLVDDKASSIITILIIQQSWIDTVRTEWFACVSQKSLTPACAQSYIATISRLSHKLLDVVINLQDEKVHKLYFYNNWLNHLFCYNRVIVLYILLLWMEIYLHWISSLTWKAVIQVLLMMYVSNGILFINVDIGRYYKFSGIVLCEVPYPVGRVVVCLSVLYRGSWCYQ